MKSKTNLVNVSKYHHSLEKRLFDLVFSILIVLLLSPLFLFLILLLLIVSGKPIFFIQERIGKSGKKFKIFKFRTMKKNANREQRKYMKLNQADGPTFKIYNDPRFTKMGKVLSRLGLDELPQLINVTKGDMSIVGPRPLPTHEANKLSDKQKVREQVRPGITSSWVVNGSHNMSFIKWMALDTKYVKDASFWGDIKIITRTVAILLKLG